MANIKITDLTAYGDPTSTDVLPIVDVGADVTKKVSIADLLENAGSGTASAPGIAFDGDSNTGIYRPGDDQLAISTNGTGRLFVDANGNVGLGTSSPQHSAHISSSSNFGAVLKISDVASKATGALVLGDGISSQQACGIWRGAANSYSTAGNTLNIQGYGIQFMSGGLFGAATERMRITDTGLVGINTTNPGVALHVDGDIRCDGVYGETDTNTSIQFPGSNATAFNQGGSEAARIDSTGRLLVGLSSSISNVGLNGLQLNSFAQVHGLRPYLAISTVNNTNWVRICAFSYNATNTTDAGNLTEIKVLVSGSAGNNWASARIVINRKQQTSSKFYDVKMYDNCGSSINLTGRVAWRYDASGGDNSAGLLEVWVRPIATFMSVNCLISSVTPLAGEFTPLDTGSETQPTGSTILVSADSWDSSNNLTLSGTATAAGFTLNDAGNIVVGTTTGTKIGTATTQKLGFYNAAPVVQPTAVADATDAASVITQLNALLSRMRDLGLIAT